MTTRAPATATAPRSHRRRLRSALVARPKQFVPCKHNTKADSISGALEVYRVGEEQLTAFSI